MNGLHSVGHKNYDGLCADSYIKAENGLFLPEKKSFVGGQMEGGFQNLDGFRQPQLGSSIPTMPTSVCIDVDATQSASYSGSGTNWANLATAPADGSAQAAYDFTLTSSPTFTGSAGNSAAYFLLGGTSYFVLASGTNTTFLNNLHKTTGGADFWFAMALRYITPSGSRFFCGTGQTGSIGCGALIGAGNSPSVWQRGTSLVTDTSGITMTTATNYLFLFSYSHSNNNIRYWVNTRTKANSALTFNTTTSSASNPICFAAEGAGAAPLPNTTRVYACSMGNAYIDDADAAKIYDVYNLRQGRTYA